MRAPCDPSEGAGRGGREQRGGASGRPRDEWASPRRWYSDGHARAGSSEPRTEWRPVPGSGEEAALVFGALWEPTPGARVERAQEAGGGVEKDQDGWSQCRPERWVEARGPGERLRVLPRGAAVPGTGKGASDGGRSPPWMPTVRNEGAGGRISVGALGFDLDFQRL